MGAGGGETPSARFPPTPRGGGGQGPAGRGDPADGTPAKWGDLWRMGVQRAARGEGINVGPDRERAVAVGDILGQC